MSVEKSFLALMMEGRAFPDEIDDFIETWHEGDDKSSLSEYLGMTQEEYRLWFHDPDALTIIAFARRLNKSLREAVNDNLSEVRLAARPGDLNKMNQLQRWLEEISSS